MLSPLTFPRAPGDGLGTPRRPPRHHHPSGSLSWPLESQQPQAPQTTASKCSSLRTSLPLTPEQLPGLSRPLWLPESLLCGDLPPRTHPELPGPGTSAGPAWAWLCALRTAALRSRRVVLISFIFVFTFNLVFEETEAQQCQTEWQAAERAGEPRSVLCQNG